MALIAKYVARHRLREPRLLDTIANFLLKRGEQLDSKVSVLPSLPGDAWGWLWGCPGAGRNRVPSLPSGWGISLGTDQDVP